jgi:hypothetical protein
MFVKENNLFVKDKICLLIQISQICKVDLHISKVKQMFDPKYTIINLNLFWYEKTKLFISDAVYGIRCCVM